MKLQLLTAALIAGAIFSANAQQVYGEDFFVDLGVGGFNSGTINGQNGWSTITDDGQVFSGCNVSEDIPHSLTSTWDFLGPDALSIEADNNFSASTTGTTFGCFGPTLFNGPVITESGTLSTMVMINKDDDPATTGATYAIEMLDSENITSSVLFLPDGSIQVLDIIEGVPAYVFANTTWSDQEWFQFTINYEFLQNHISYIINGVSIYEGTPLFGVQLQRFAFLHDNNNGSKAYFDSIFAFADESLSTAETTKSKVMVFPNPAQGSFTISDNNADLETLKIFDLNGRLVKTLPLNNSINPRIDIADLSNGLYLLDIHSANGVTKTKFIKN